MELDGQPNRGKRHVHVINIKTDVTDDLQRKRKKNSSTSSSLTIRRISSAWRYKRKLRRHVPQWTRRLATNLISAQPGPLTYRLTLSPNWLLSATQSCGRPVRAPQDVCGGEQWTNKLYKHSHTLLRVGRADYRYGDQRDDVRYMFVVTRHFATFHKEKVRGIYVKYAVKLAEICHRLGQQEIFIHDKSSKVVIW